MSLTDLMRHADLSVYPQIGLIIFLGVFVAVSLRAMRLNRSQDIERISRLALEDDAADPNGGDA